MTGSSARPRRHPVRPPADVAREAIRASGARLTRQRTRVLSVLLSAERALTHHELERRLERGPGIDRVTLYRALEWLTRQGLAHRIAGENRVWRFTATTDGRSPAHAHFECGGCGAVLCLAEVRAGRAVPLPAGYRGERVELTVKGRCAECAPARGRTRRRPGRRQPRGDEPSIR
ncbi:MAG: transcriptional repressor [Burkholderiales bacterium]|nr:transcriptional repressor [Burkholderiales bacterium]